MSQSEHTDQISAALAVAQSSMKAAHINKTNPHFKNKYADLSAVIEAIRLPLAANGIAFSQTLTIPTEGVLWLETVLLHKSGQWIASIYPLPSGVKPQELGSALTYGRRYSLSSICGIAADEDDDAEETRTPNSPVVAKAAEKLRAQSRPGVITDTISGSKDDLDD